VEGVTGVAAKLRAAAEALERPLNVEAADGVKVRVRGVPPPRSTRPRERAGRVRIPRLLDVAWRDKRGDVVRLRDLIRVRDATEVGSVRIRGSRHRRLTDRARVHH